jgi:hypothetical protein
LRRAAKPILDEKAASAQRLDAAADDWREWWERRGERELRCILMTAWDPVGVGDVAEAWDEYDSYLPGVAQRLRDADDEEDAARRVAEYLHHVERDFMGLATGSTPESSHLASALAAWHEWSFVRDAQPPRERPNEA